MRGLRLHAATVRAFGALMKANSKRRNHHPHQQDGHRRALKGNPQHGIRLTRWPVFSVTCVTNSDRRLTGPSTFKRSGTGSQLSWPVELCAGLPFPGGHVNLASGLSGYSRSRFAAVQCGMEGAARTVYPAIRWTRSANCGRFQSGDISWKSLPGGSFPEACLRA